MTATFLFGSAELYDWMDRNRRVRMLRTETTNDPARHQRAPPDGQINTALQVDLYAQANATRLNGRIYSGFGGQTDFIVGALHSLGGHALIALRSWHPRADCRRSSPWSRAGHVVPADRCRHRERRRRDLRTAPSACRQRT